MDIISYIIQTYLICFGLTFIAFLIFLITKKVTTIDVFWPICISTSIIYGSVTTISPTKHSIALYLILGLWAIRLIWHISYYKLRHQDVRYTKMAKGSLTKGMAKQYFIQTFFQTIVAISGIYLTQPIYSSKIVFYAAIFLSIVSITGEFLSDKQLQDHLKTSKELCKNGLWQYSRHPNYFFDIMFWICFTLAGFSSSLFLISLIGPLFLFITIYFITGPYTERCSVEKHGSNYTNYQKSVSYFIPLPKKDLN